jgi:F420-dependent oxidoreductase-like protein
MIKVFLMQLRVFTEPQQGATYAALERLAIRAEDAGFDAFFRSDHYLTMGSGDGLPGPTDSWITLAGLALATTRIRLGTLVSPATFRLPGPLAITVAQVDAMSAGRVELGLGAGWYEGEHAAYGIPFPPAGIRFSQLEEQLAIISGLWATPVGQWFDFAGEHYTVTHSPALPKPVQHPGPPIIVGGHGARRTPQLAARFADEFNVGFSPVEVVAKQYERVAAASEQVGRAASGRAPLVLSAALVVCCGRTDEEIARRAKAIGRSVEELREHGACGTPEEVAATIRRYAHIGATRIYLQVLDVSDVDHLDLIAEVAPLLD